MKFLLALLLLVPTFAMAEDSVFVVLEFRGGPEQYNHYAKVRISKEIFEMRNETGISLSCRSKLDIKKHQYRLIDGDISYIVNPVDRRETGYEGAISLNGLGNIFTIIDYGEVFKPVYIVAFQGEAVYKNVIKDNPQLAPLDELKEIIPSKPSKIISYNSFFCLYVQNGEYINPPDIN